jgi:hypothetical protein
MLQGVNRLLVGRAHTFMHMHVCNTSPEVGLNGFQVQLNMGKVLLVLPMQPTLSYQPMVSSLHSLLRFIPEPHAVTN